MRNIRSHSPIQPVTKLRDVTTILCYKCFCNRWMKNSPRPSLNSKPLTSRLFIIPKLFIFAYRWSTDCCKIFIGSVETEQDWTRSRHRFQHHIHSSFRGILRCFLCCIQLQSLLRQLLLLLISNAPVFACSTYLDCGANLDHGVTLDEKLCKILSQGLVVVSMWNSLCHETVSGWCFLKTFLHQL